MDDRSITHTPDKRLAAVCGLFCPSCQFYIGTNEDPERLKILAGRRNRQAKELECHGCRSEKRKFNCENCKMSKCADKKGFDFCGDCEEYPCSELKEFQAQLPHRIELWQSQERIKEVGYEKWYIEMIEHYSCTECSTLNSAYDSTCWKCGATPSCNYVKLRKDEIIEQLAKFSGSP